jgi:hypothetical protein
VDLFKFVKAEDEFVKGCVIDSTPNGSRALVVDRNRTVLSVADAAYRRPVPMPTLAAYGGYASESPT